MFVDNVKIYVKAGDGGIGAVAFHREKYVSHGGPDGGDGGHGGSIVFRVDEGTNTLLAFRYRHKFIAQNGGNGRGGKLHGATAENLYIMVCTRNLADICIEHLCNKRRRWWIFVV